MLLVISGPIGVGKSTLMKKIANKLSETHDVGGIITIGQEQRFFLDLKTSKQSIFSKDNDEKGEKIGKYLLSHRALLFASEALISSQDSDIILIDEIGVLENRKKGLYKPIKELIGLLKGNEKKVILAVVREKILKDISKLYSIIPDKIWIIEISPKEGLLEEIIKYMQEKRI